MIIKRSGSAHRGCTPYRLPPEAFPDTPDFEKVQQAFREQIPDDPRVEDLRQTVNTSLVSDNQRLITFHFKDWSAHFTYVEENALDPDTLRAYAAFGTSTPGVQIDHD